MASELDIGEVHDRTGLQPSTLRYYEQRGLIASSGRNGLRRRYQPDVIGRLAVIRTAQAAVRDQLRHAIKCQSPRLIDCPHFQRHIDASFAAQQAEGS